MLTMIDVVAVADRGSCNEGTACARVREVVDGQVGAAGEANEKFGGIRVQRTNVLYDRHLVVRTGATGIGRCAED